MKIKSVTYNNRNKTFESKLGGSSLRFPYSKATPAPDTQDPVVRTFVDNELAREAFTYILKSGAEGTVHTEQILEYNQDPAYLRDLLLYKLTIEAQKRVESSPLSKREIVRRLDTSATQLYRILDHKNYRKSVDQVLSLLHVLDCDVDLIVKTRKQAKSWAA